jgi:hypothetical protein
MRRSPRTSLLALPLAALALAAAGCGGSQIAADEVPGNPPALTVPSDSELGAAGSSANGSADASTGDSTDQSAATGATSTATPAPADPSGGTTAPTTQAAPEDTTGGATPPPAGSPPQQFESFCEQNAGAC